MRHVTVVDETRGTQIGDRVAVAETAMTRMFGLLPRRGLDAGEGLWIKPSSGVHTFGMRFTIDVIGLDKERRVVRLWPELRPWRMTAVSLKVASVVELPAGRIAGCGVELGDVVGID